MPTLLPQWNGLKPGDIVTAYKKGYYRLDEIHDRSAQKYKTPINGKDAPDPLAVVSRVMDTAGNIGKKPAKPDQCDIAYCTLVARSTADSLYQKAVTEATHLRDQTYAVLAQYGS